MKTGELLHFINKFSHRISLLLDLLVLDNFI